VKGSTHRATSALSEIWVQDIKLFDQQEIVAREMIMLDVRTNLDVFQHYADDIIIVNIDDDAGFKSVHRIDRGYRTHVELVNRQRTVGMLYQSIGSERNSEACSRDHINNLNYFWISQINPDGLSKWLIHL